MPEFIATKGGGARLLLDDAETDIIRRLAGELHALISGRRAADPVLDRLFPSAYEDETDERDYQELIGNDLATHKLEALDAISTSLGTTESDVTLEGETLHAWLACLTDLRLAIGTRLSIDEERMAADIDPDDPDARSIAVLHWLGWIQEGLLQTASAL